MSCIVFVVAGAFWGAVRARSVIQGCSLGVLVLIASLFSVCLRRRRRSMLLSLALASSSLSWFGSRLPILRFIAIKCNERWRFSPTTIRPATSTLFVLGSSLSIDFECWHALILLTYIELPMGNVIGKVNPSSRKPFHCLFDAEERCVISKNPFQKHPSAISWSIWKWRTRLLLETVSVANDVAESDIRKGKRTRHRMRT